MLLKLLCSCVTLVIIISEVTSLATPATCEPSYPVSCTAFDEFGRLWNNTDINQCPGNASHGCARWQCLDGVFLTEFPDYLQCSCQQKCQNTYNIDGLDLYFETCPGTTAISNCPGSRQGYASWYCNTDGVFEEPDFTKCCESEICRGVDTNATVWVGCSGHIVEKISKYSDSMFWECTNGSFKGRDPWCGCGCPKHCTATDENGLDWSACVGDLGVNNCTSNGEGTAVWQCGKDGVFVNSPDYSNCTPSWFNDINNYIAAGDLDDALDEVETNTADDGDIGLANILDILELIVDLFNSKYEGTGDWDIFQQFVYTYAQILNNILDEKTWTDISSNEDRIKYGTQLLSITEKVVYSLKTIYQGPVIYNHTFVATNNSGIVLSVQYLQDINNLEFIMEEHLANCTASITLENTEDGYTYVVQNMVIPPAKAVYMFPLGDKMKILNAAFLTYTIGKYKGNEDVEKITKGVDLKTHFTNARSARYPATTTIHRGLHTGEEPSPVADSGVCSYWDEILQEWSTNGCTPSSQSKTDIRCECSHLTSFSIIMGIHKYKEDPALQGLSITFGIITIISLILTILILIILKQLKQDKHKIILHISICLLLGHILVMFFMDRTFFNYPDAACVVFGVLQHYVFLAAFAWMAIQGHYIYQLFIVVFKNKSYYKIYLIVGYTSPLVIVVLTLIIGYATQDQPYAGQDEMCWLSTPKYVWSFIVPVIVVIIGNFIFFGIAITTSLKKRADTRNPNSKRRSLLIGSMSLAVLLGITWVFGLFYIVSTRFFVYLFVILNGLQGFFIFYFQCVYDANIRKDIQDLFKKRKTGNVQSSSSKAKSRTTMATSEITLSSSSTNANQQIKKPDINSSTEDDKGTIIISGLDSSPKPITFTSKSDSIPTPVITGEPDSIPTPVITTGEPDMILSPVVINDKPDSIISSEIGTDEPENMPIPMIVATGFDRDSTSKSTMSELDTSTNNDADGHDKLIIRVNIRVDCIEGVRKFQTAIIGPDGTLSIERTPDSFDFMDKREHVWNHKFINLEIPKFCHDNDKYTIVKYTAEVF